MLIHSSQLLYDMEQNQVLKGKEEQKWLRHLFCNGRRFDITTILIKQAQQQTPVKQKEEEESEDVDMRDFRAQQLLLLH